MKCVKQVWPDGCKELKTLGEKTHLVPCFQTALLGKESHFLASSGTSGYFGDLKKRGICLNWHNNLTYPCLLCFPWQHLRTGFLWSSTGGGDGLSHLAELLSFPRFLPHIHEVSMLWNLFLSCSSVFYIVGLSQELRRVEGKLFFLSYI